MLIQGNVCCVWQHDYPTGQNPGAWLSLLGLSSFPAEPKPEWLVAKHQRLRTSKVTRKQGVSFLCLLGLFVFSLCFCLVVEIVFLFFFYFFLIGSWAAANLTRQIWFCGSKIEYLRLGVVTGVEQEIQVTYLSRWKKFGLGLFCAVLLCLCWLQQSCHGWSYGHGTLHVIVGVRTILQFHSGRQLHHWLLQFLYQDIPYGPFFQL